MTGLPSPTTVVTAGAGLLADAVEAQAVATRRVDWQPPQGDPAALARVLGDARRRDANARALDAMLTAEATLVDVRPAHEVLDLQPGQFLHAGPPITWERASGPLRGALIGAMLLEGLAADAEEAERRLAAGDGVAWEPCHHRGGVGPMAGVVSPSMWVMELRDDAHGNTSWCTLNEGLGKVLRYGAYGPEVIERLRWMGDVLGPLMQTAVRTAGPVDVRAIIGQMVQMGDEGHNRNRAGTLMLLRELLPTLIDSGRPSAEVAGAVDEIVARGVPFATGRAAFRTRLARLARQAHVAARGEEPAVVVAQPTCSYVLKFDYPDYLGGEDADLVAAHTYDAAEYLWQVHKGEGPGLDREFPGEVPAEVTYHAPCHLRAQNVGLKSRDLLKLTGAKVTVVAECSGIDGGWGLREVNYPASRKVAAKMAKAIDKAGGDAVAGDCHLANGGIVQETGRTPVHPLSLLARAYGIAED